MFLGWDPRSLQTQICMQECLAGQGVVKGKLKMNIRGKGRLQDSAAGNEAPPPWKQRDDAATTGLPQPTPGALELSPLHQDGRPLYLWRGHSLPQRETGMTLVRQLSGWGPFLRGTQLPTLPKLGMKTDPATSSQCSPAPTAQAMIKSTFRNERVATEN